MCKLNSNKGGTLDAMTMALIHSSHRIRAEDAQVRGAGRWTGGQVGRWSGKGKTGRGIRLHSSGIRCKYRGRVTPPPVSNGAWSEVMMSPTSLGLFPVHARVPTTSAASAT
ncbi:hypothetical protein COEREDRAFT_11452 [Coemansia reversa NRRL 1564]|uniref:Uncharacterized protein n=1 Tax=Coemansia reversa (strain ATCC 12441 / NRRL 1564) TaxID=763665 RepID=A0A2G5B3Z9_COERN|nr:hypothetical protein COEREDRAFT_11452 [Coemansia reversa NRRL 1564]|eukprot:PIA13457.1 hypothetical protein COEREDRAFT_11452 [Coemansia reversa NRRL 1564]